MWQWLFKYFELKLVLFSFNINSKTDITPLIKPVGGVAEVPCVSENFTWWLLMLQGHQSKLSVMTDATSKSLPFCKGYFPSTCLAVPLCLTVSRKNLLCTMVKRSISEYTCSFNHFLYQFWWSNFVFTATAISIILSLCYKAILSLRLKIKKKT